MLVTNYGTLKSNVLVWINRRDMASRVDEFVDAAHMEIVKWLGRPLDKLVVDSDANEVLLGDPYIYEYGAIANGFAAIRNGEQYAFWQDKFQQKLTSMSAYGFPHDPNPVETTPSVGGIVP